MIASIAIANPHVQQFAKWGMSREQGVEERGVG